MPICCLSFFSFCCFDDSLLFQHKIITSNIALVSIFYRNVILCYFISLLQWTIQRRRRVNSRFSADDQRKTVGNWNIERVYWVDQVDEINGRLWSWWKSLGIVVNSRNVKICMTEMCSYLIFYKYIAARHTISLCHRKDARRWWKRFVK